MFLSGRPGGPRAASPAHGVCQRLGSLEEPSPLLWHPTHTPPHADGCPNCQPAFVRRVKSSRQSSPLCHFSGLRGCPHYWDGGTPQPALPTSLGSSSAELCSPPCLQDVSALSRTFADPVTPGSPIPSRSTVQLPGLAGASPPHPPSEAGHGVTRCT